MRPKCMSGSHPTDAIRWMGHGQSQCPHDRLASLADHGTPATGSIEREVERGTVFNPSFGPYGTSLASEDALDGG